MNAVNKVVRIHVFLEFYTLNKFKSLPTLQTTQVTTLFKSPDEQRYLNITNGGTVLIISAAGSEKVKIVRDISLDDIYKASVILSSSPSPLTPSPTPTPSSSPSSSSPSPLTSSPSAPSPTPTFSITLYFITFSINSIFIPSFIIQVQHHPNSKQGFMNVTNRDIILIVSVVGSDQAAVVQDIVSDENYYISVVQISKVIVLSGLHSPISSPSPSIPSPSLSTPSPSLLASSPSPSLPPSSTLNITKILNDYPDFNQFNSYLTETQVCDQINVRTTITVFVVNNAAMSYLVGKSNEVKKKVLSLHIVMDYYTFDKLKSFPNSQTTQLTTLLQDTFQSIGFQGFLNATNGDTISIIFVAGSEKVQVVKDIFTKNLKLSVVQISNLIVPSDLNDSPCSLVPSSSPSPPPPSTSTPSLSPSSFPSPPSGHFDITKILSDNLDFNLFSTYLTQTQNANQINDGAMTSLVDKPMEIKRKVLSLHVIMDYYTIQITNQPSDLQGLVNITNGDKITIVSTAGFHQAVVVLDVANDEPSYISVVFMAPTPSHSSTPGKAQSSAPIPKKGKAPTSSNAIAPKAPKQGETPPSNGTAPEAPKQGEASPSNSSAPKTPKQGDVSSSNGTKLEEPRQGRAPIANGTAHEEPPLSNRTLSEALQQGEASTSPNAQTSDAPTSSNAAPSSGGTAHGTTTNAPTLNSSRRYSVNCASFITTILVAIYSLTCNTLT
ncbi:fasciclin-like arabinogalactan protein 8 [Pyrus ussuriensis x Pyrus communis]|uniref:Fasciclin-like arabinogalactan protein 8 n=1 Tax=Pyrus ussuriensis x Pyrus communis TaxID=2448454 RepID=A0A5N5GFS9_9ROSA|nr:fasciclin-like arabinogalactan protein 8 [Pyrus ussuriensis x Pyrus communis]